MWGRGQVRTGFWWGNLKEGENLDDLGGDGRMILRWMFKKCAGGVDWMDLVECRDKWQTPVNVVMNLRVP
jgi:hypothetical protein